MKKKDFYSGIAAVVCRLLIKACGRRANKAKLCSNHRGGCQS